MKGKVKGKIIALASLALASLMAFTTAVTAAAFFNYELHQQEIVIDMGYGKYFAGGDGKEATPYQISTSEHLRNLSKLVNMGAFGPEDHFRLTQDITYSGVPLTPIGTSDSPFVSHFDGMVNNNQDRSVVRVINNLVVEGNNLSDVGMFGYIGNTGYVGNFILNAPTISAKGETSFDYLNLDKNPIRKIISEAQIRTIKMINPVFNESDPKKGMTSFEVDISGLPKTYTLGSKTDVPLNYYFDISRPEYLTKDTAATATNKFNVLATTEPQGFDYTKNKGKYFTLEIGVQAVVYDETTKTNKFSNFVLERFKLYYDLKGDFIVADPDDACLYGKMIYTDVRLTPISANEAEATDFSRAIFVGAVAGRLDGVADYIGVADMKLNILRPFISYSLIIGKTIDDDANRTLSREEVNFHDMFTENNVDALTLTEIPKYLEGYTNESGAKIENCDRGKGNYIVNGIYGVPNGLTKNAINNVRIYATGDILKDNKITPAPKQNVNLGTVHADLTEDGTSFIRKEEKLPNINYPTGNVKSISFTDDMDVEYLNPVGVFSLYGYNNVKASNTIMMWISAQDTQGWLAKLLSGKLDFYLNFEIDYMFFDDDPSMAANDAVSSKELQVWAARKSIGKADTDPIIGKPANYKYPKVDRRDYTVTDYKKFILEKVSTANEPKQYQHAVIEDPLNPNNTKIRNNLKFYHNNWAGPVTGDPVSTEVQTMKIRIHPVKASGYSELTKGHMPIFFFGIFDNDRGSIDIQKPGPNEGDNGYVAPKDKRYPYRFDLLSMKIILSDLHGNMESTLGTIDFVQGGNNPTIPIRSNVFDSSKVKVKAQTINNIKNVPIDSTNVASFLSVHTEGNKNSGVYNDGYAIKVTRSGSRVTVNWNVATDKNPANFTFINPHNTEGFKEATIRRNQNLTV